MYYTTIYLAHGVNVVDTIQRDKAQQQDRIVAVYNAEAGWQFGCEEQMARLKSLATNCTETAR